MKQKNSTILETTVAIQQIGNLTKAPKAVFALAKNLRKLKSAVEDYETARKGIWKEIFGDDDTIKKDDERVPQFTKQEKEVLDTEVEVDIHQFSLSDLNLDVNSISPGVLSAISWLIKDF